MSIEQKTIFIEGSKAAYSGKSRDDNPYAHGSWQEPYWYSGWDSANEDTEMDYDWWIDLGV